MLKTLTAQRWISASLTAYDNVAANDLIPMQAWNASGNLRFEHIHRCRAESGMANSKFQTDSLCTAAFTGRLDGIPMVLLRPTWSKCNIFRGSAIYGGSYSGREAYLYFPGTAVLVGAAPQVCSNPLDPVLSQIINTLSSSACTIVRHLCCLCFQASMYLQGMPRVPEGFWAAARYDSCT